MFRWLMTVLLIVTGSVASAQHQLTMPDLTALTSSGNAPLLLEPRSGWLYVLGASRIMGVKSSGLARVSVDGFVDTSWQPTGVQTLQSHVIAPHGDVYTLSASGNVTNLSRYSAARGGAPIFRTAVGPAEYAAGAIPMLIGGHDRWLYYSRYERGVYGSGMGTKIKWNRLDTTTDQIDSQWSYSVVLAPGADAASASMTLGADGSIYVSVVKTVVGVANGGTATITRVATDSSASPLWTQEFTTERFSMAADAQGRPYVLTCPGSCATQAAVLRLNSVGAVDFTWNRVDASRAVSQSVKPATLSIVDNELLVSTVLQKDSATTNAALIRVDANGVEKARWVATSAGAIGEIFGARAGKLYLRFGREILVLDATALREVAAPSFGFGGVGWVSHALALPDGGYVIFGSFDVWYGGRRFSNALRFRADGLPDLTWAPKLESGTINQVTLTPRGVVVVGRFDLAAKYGPGTRAFLISLAPGAATDPTWGSDWPRYPFSQSYDGGAFFYVLAGEYPVDRILRVSLATGLLDPGWEISAVPSAAGRSVSAVSVGADLAGGVWLFWQEQDYFISPFKTLIQRFSVADRREVQRFIPEGTQVSRITFLSTAEHMYIGDRRYELSKAGAWDPTWSLVNPGGYSTIELAQARGRYLYVMKDGLRRALTAGNGTIDASFGLVLPTPGEPNRNLPPVWVQSPGGNGDDLEFVLTALQEGQPVDIGFVTTRNTATPDKTIVEYFNRDAARYFITGRASEQALLDGLPASFQRTGMQFSARSSVYRDIPEVPICRFYSAPENGGSNTHFYGSGDDCPALNTVLGLRYEGYDFSTIKPINQSCTASTPNAVSRLFKNKSASNQGNHRYVVSAATKAKMLALGWIDEGVVFCVATATDATQ